MRNEYEQLLWTFNPFVEAGSSLKHYGHILMADAGIAVTGGFTR